MQGHIILILITGVLDFFFVKGCFFCSENLDSIPKNTVSTFTGFCAVLEFIGIFFFFVFTGPEYEHENFISKPFIWAKSHFIILQALEIP